MASLDQVVSRRAAEVHDSFYGPVWTKTWFYFYAYLYSVQSAFAVAAGRVFSVSVQTVQSLVFPDLLKAVHPPADSQGP